MVCWVADKNNNHKSPEWEKLPTERIYDLMQTGHEVYLKLTSPGKELLIDPYVFGAWLGDVW